MTPTTEQDKKVSRLIDKRRDLAAQLAGVDMELAIEVGDRDAACRAMREMNAQVVARYAAKFSSCAGADQQ